MIKIKDDHEMISTFFQKNLKLLEKAKEATKEEHELILLIIIYELDNCYYFWGFFSEP